MARKYDGANWNNQEDSFTQKFLEQNQTQFWKPEEIPIANDIRDWGTLTKEEQEAYTKNLQVLTFLDTYQGDIGMPVVSNSIPAEYHQRKAVLNFMASMENGVHAKSYSNIFMTLISTEEINELFEWGETNESLQGIVHTIVSAYENLDDYIFMRKRGRELYKKVTKTELLERLIELGGMDTKEAKEYTSKIMDSYSKLPATDELRKQENLLTIKDVSEQEYLEVQWKALVSSVFLETYLFYSGFFYPLYFYGKGKMMQSGEIINLIIR